MNHPTLPSFVLRLATLSLCLLACAPACLSAAERAFDFGDRSASTLVSRAWAAHDANDLTAVRAYVAKLRELHEAEALRQQQSLDEPIPATDKERVFSLAALNGVGTGLFILGQMEEKHGIIEEALKAYNFCVAKLSFAQCWDEKGWFWKPAEAAQGRLRVLEFEMVNSAQSARESEMNRNAESKVRFN